MNALTFHHSFFRLFNYNLHHACPRPYDCYVIVYFCFASRFHLLRREFECAHFERMANFERKSEFRYFDRMNACLLICGKTTVPANDRNRLNYINSIDFYFAYMENRVLSSAAIIG